MNNPTEEEHPGPGKGRSTQRYRDISTRSTSVRPEYHVVLIGITSTFEKVEKQMPRFNVDVSGVRAAMELKKRNWPNIVNALDSSVAKAGLLDSYIVRREERMTKRRELRVGQSRERFERREETLIIGRIRPPCCCVNLKVGERIRSRLQSRSICIKKCLRCSVYYQETLKCHGRNFREEHRNGEQRAGCMALNKYLTVPRQ